MNGKPVSLGFIQADIDTQLRTSRELLESIRELESTRDKLGEQKVIIEDVITRLSRLTQDLISNATRTGKTVADLVRNS